MGRSLAHRAWSVVYKPTPAVKLLRIHPPRSGSTLGKPTREKKEVALLVCRGVPLNFERYLFRVSRKKYLSIHTVMNSREFSNIK
jgi:hypothetical protein